MKKTIIILVLVNLSFNCQKETISPASSGFNPDFELGFKDPTQDKNFYLFSSIQRSKAIRDLFLSLTELEPFNQRFILGFNAAKNTCNGDVTCIDQLLRWKANEIDEIANILSDKVGEAELERLINQQLRPSGLFIRYDSLSKEAFLKEAWRDAITGINNILDVYGLGRPPFYASIDKISYDASSQEYKDLVSQQLKSLNLDENTLFFEPSLKYAMLLLKVNNRDEAGRYEPMHQNDNKAVYERIPQIKWDSFEYSMILVPGDSPNEPEDFPNISLGGMARADYGVQLYKAGKAPIIAFSGGHVRPFQTPFSEAIEMKKYIMEKHGIPEAAILVDPHARHTTTNFRNISRLVFRYGIPASKTALVSTTESQCKYIASDRFFDRCIEELGYLPLKIVERINNRQVAFLPEKASLQADNSDPLDP